MGVALGIRTLRLVDDWRNYAEDTVPAIAILGVVDSEAALQRWFIRTAMALDALTAVPADQSPGLTGVAGKCYPAILVDDSDALYFAMIADSLDRFVETTAVIRHHGAVGIVADKVADFDCLFE
jgi:hypothetical protein